MADDLEYTVELWVVSGQGSVLGTEFIFAQALPSLHSLIGFLDRNPVELLEESSEITQ